MSKKEFRHKAKKTKETKKITNQEKFFSFVFQKQQRIDLLIIGGICLAGYIVLKLCYPFPATMSDSGGYVVSAQNNLFSFYRPFGYSCFLRIIHFFSSSVHAVFAVQMLLYAASIAFFALSVKYFFRPTHHKVIWYALLVFLTFNPMAFFMANAIMSDMLFAVLIFAVLTTFIFVVMRKNWIAFGLFSLFLFFTLHIRYSAFVFPFIFIPFVLNIKGALKWVSLVVLPLLFLIFYGQIKSEMKKTTGFNQYSTGFDGWQLANNALHIVPHIDLSAAAIKNPSIRDLHAFVDNYKAVILENTGNGKSVSASFLWANNLPLKQYLQKTMQERNLTYPYTWIYLGSGVYKDYGWYIIRHYPVEFMKYYFLPNTSNMFYTSFAGIMGSYAVIDGKDIINWYNIKDTKNLDSKYDLYGKFLSKIISISYGIVWIFILCIGLYAFRKRKNIRFGKEEKILFWAFFTFGAIYYSSTIFASPIELRYWLPMSVIRFSFMYILLHKLQDSILPTVTRNNEQKRVPA
ncbi:MAG: hypothetical protein LBT25_13180 [Candidatus Symbiothrix sp.]|jgi:hypothetical protein|nr:hypothetical protein [Candidatus Symbiothrix sp.]